MADIEEREFRYESISCSSGFRLGRYRSGCRINARARVVSRVSVDQCEANLVCNPDYGLAPNSKQVVIQRVSCEFRTQSGASITSMFFETRKSDVLSGRHCELTSTTRTLIVMATILDT